jgi:diguanylate cyclase (GGDEF)-like protein
MADIDHFKKVNDEHGHAVGDEVIRLVTESMKSVIRTSDAICRYGGEEFCIALVDTSVEAATRVAERIRAKIDSPSFARVPLTVSFGVTTSGFGAATLAELINQADEALYAAKNAGRNRVTRWDERGASAT